MSATAGNQSKTKPRVFNPIGRKCKFIFAEVLTEELTSSISPLLDNLDRGDMDASAARPLQPENPTSEQVERYEAFCQSILDFCTDKSYYTSPTEESSSIIPPRQPEESPQVTDLTFVEKIVLSIYEDRVSDMAQLFLQTCPGDWSGGWGPYMRGILSRAASTTNEDFAKRIAEKEEDYDSDDDGTSITTVPGAIRFHWEVGRLADDMVHTFDLADPHDQMCIGWDIHESHTHRGRLYELCFALASRIEQIPHRNNRQGPQVHRFYAYLATVVARLKLSEEETEGLMERFLAFVQDVKASHMEQALADPDVVQQGQDWLRSIQETPRCFP